ncbi:hypothetical protein ACLOJK_028554 [Asimina triloba]
MGSDTLIDVGREAVRKLIYGCTDRGIPFNAFLRVVMPLLGGIKGDDAYPHHQSLTSCASSYSMPDRVHPMAEKQFVSSEDLVVVKNCYSIPSSIIPSAPELHETPRDYCPRHICLHESMLKAGIRVPSEFGVAEALLVFHVAASYVVFTGRGNVKIIDNSPDSTPGWKLRGAGGLPAAGLDVSSGDHPSMVSFEASVHLIAVAPTPSSSEAERKYETMEHLRKRARSLTEGESVLAELSHKGIVHPTPASPPEVFLVVVGLDSSSEGFFGLPPLERTPRVIDLEEERDVSLLREQVTLLKLREAKLLSKREAEGEVRSLVVAEYLRSDIHRRREEFEWSHYSQSGSSGGDLAQARPVVDLYELRIE